MQFSLVFGHAKCVASVALALALVTGGAAAQDRTADTGGDPDGGANCVISGDATKDDRTAGHDRVSESDPCAAIEAVLNRRRLQHLERVLAASRLRTIARFLRANPEVMISSFTYQPGLQTASQFCCSCLPGQTCSASIAEDVCTFNPEGASCPSGDLRALCDFSGDSGVLCSAIE